MLTRSRSAQILALAALLALAACSGRGEPTPTASVAPAATATATVEAPAPATAAPADTQSPAPTDTSAPRSPTPTPADTPTPAAPATPDPNQGVGSVVYQDNLDGSSQWFWGFTDEVASFGIADDGRLRAVMSQANGGWRFTIGPDTLRIGSQQVRITANPAACAEKDEYGLLLRTSQDAEDNFSMYLFRLRCGGGARFDRVTGTTMMPLQDWTASPAIQTGAGAENTLMVWAGGSEFRLYVNDEYLFSVQDDGLADGYYGVYIYDRSAGSLTVNFSALAARAVTP